MNIDLQIVFNTLDMKIILLIIFVVSIFISSLIIIKIIVTIQSTS